MRTVELLRRGGVELESVVVRPQVGGERTESVVGLHEVGEHFVDLGNRVGLEVPSGPPRALLLDLCECPKPGSRWGHDAPGLVVQCARQEVAILAP